MTSSNTHEWRQGADKSERLFRSAISAYCALVRPTKRDAIQLDDLTLPLLPLVSVEGRRFAAAALSEMGPPATTLVRRLAEEPVEISAPLLTRSACLADADLIGLIGRHGLAHARAIGRRAGLNANIAKLIAALGAAEEKVETMEPADNDVTTESMMAEIEDAATQQRDAAEEVRVQLRSMMARSKPAKSKTETPVAPPLDWEIAAADYAKLLSTSLTGSDAFFHTALADALDISFGAAQTLDDEDAPGLTLIMRALDLPVEKAFLVASLVYPYALVGHETVAAFVESYQKLDLASARDEVSMWRERDARQRQIRARDWEPVADAPANDTASNSVQVLRAS